MEEIVNIIVSQVSIWIPSLVAILGMVATIITTLKNAKIAIDEFKQDKTFKELKDELVKAIKENETIREQYDILIDELKRIKDYRENK